MPFLRVFFNCLGEVKQSNEYGEITLHYVGLVNSNCVEQNEDIRRHISALERLFLGAGDHETGQELRKILDSTNQIVSLHSALTRKLRRRTKEDDSLSERHQFFSNFKSPSGNQLDNSQVSDLFNITSKWKLDDADVETLQLCSRLWTNNPGLFWEGEKHEDDTIRRLFNDLQRMEEIDPTKRKVLLVKLSQEIENEQQQIEEQSEQHKRGRPRRTNNQDCHRKGVYLTTSLHKIFRRHYPRPKSSMENVQRDRFAKYSRYGWKWDQLGHTEMLLSLSGVPVKRFERRGWKSIEFMAVRKYLETLPQFRIRTDLARAWESITAYYSSGKMNADPPLRSQPGEFYDNHRLHLEMPITIIPSRLARQGKRKRGLSSSITNNKRQQRILNDSDSSISRRGANCDTDNSLVMNEGYEVSNEQSNHSPSYQSQPLPLRGNSTNIDKGSNISMPAETHAPAPPEIPGLTNNQYTCRGTSQTLDPGSLNQRTSNSNNQMNKMRTNQNQQQSNFHSEEISSSNARAPTDTQAELTVQGNLGPAFTGQGQGGYIPWSMQAADCNLDRIGDSAGVSTSDGNNFDHTVCQDALDVVIFKDQQVDLFDIFNYQRAGLFDVFDYSSPLGSNCLNDAISGFTAGGPSG